MILLRQSLTTQVTRHLSQIVSPVTMSISKMKDISKKMSTLYHLIFFEIAKESILVEFPYYPKNELVAKRFFSKFHQLTNQKFQVTIKWITKKVKSLFSLKDTITQLVKYIKERVFVMRHILVKPFGMLTFDGMSMRTYARNLNLQTI